MAFESLIYGSLDDECGMGFIEQGQLPWFALRTKSNFERVSALSLSQKGYEAFLPVYRCRRRRWDRSVDVEVPLFPGYLFCRFAFGCRLPILMTPGVVHIVGRSGAPDPVPEEEIAAVRAIVNSNLRAEPWPFLEVGQTVRMIHGPLAGVEGFLADFKGRNRLIVSITLLQRSIAAEVEGAWVRPVRKASARAATAGTAYVAAVNR